jgi:hypothetical protein
MKIQVSENTTVYRPDETDRVALKQLYDVLNIINKRVQKKDFFYTDLEVQELKKDSANVFI